MSEIASGGGAGSGSGDDKEAGPGPDDYESSSIPERMDEQIDIPEYPELHHDSTAQ